MSAAMEGHVRGNWSVAAAVGVILVSATSATGATGTPAVRALVGGTLVDGTGAAPVKNAVVVIREGRIACAGTRAACPVPKGAEEVDASGAWITPGIVDAHVHLSQTGWADSHPDSLDVRDRYQYEKVQAGLREHPERFFRSYLCSGVTAVFDVGGYPWTWSLRARTVTSPDAPHVAAVGPLLATHDYWLNLPAERQFISMTDVKTVREGVRYLAANGADGVGVWIVLQKEQRLEDVIGKLRAAREEARKFGLPLIIDATRLSEAKEALRAGAKVLVHSVIDLPVDEDFVAMAKTNCTIYCPTLNLFLGYAKMFDSVASGKPPTVDDPNGCVDPATRANVAETASLGAGRTEHPRGEGMNTLLQKTQQVATSNLRAVVAAGIPVAMGTDAGNSLTLHGPSVYAEMEAMQAAGMTPMQVLVASTRTGALALGSAGKDLGTVEGGKIADVLVVAADPTADIAAIRKVRLVIRAGVVHRVSDLAARN